MTTGGRLLGATLLVTTLLAACGGDGDGSAGGGGARRTDVPEPAVAPAVALDDLPGRVVPLAGGGEPEGLAWDTKTGIIAVAVRSPGGVVLVDAATETERVRVPLGGAARHLQLAAAGGPVLVPSENDDRLYRVTLPDGTVSAADPVGRQPHDAAPAAGGRIFVGDELADTVHVLEADGSNRIVPAPAQPGGVASSPDGSVVVVIGVRGRRIAAYAPDGRRLGETDCGVGPTHVRAGAAGSGLFYVADTQGDAILVFRAGPEGIEQVARVATGDAPYGLAFDAPRSLLYVTLTGTNQLQSYRVDGTSLVADRMWSTPRQPNDVAVDDATGRVVVAGTADGVLQFIDP